MEVSAEPRVVARGDGELFSIRPIRTSVGSEDKARPGTICSLLASSFPTTKRERAMIESTHTSRILRLPLALLAAAALLLTALGGTAEAVHEGAVYTADLGELNNSGATGQARIEVAEDGNTMTIVVTASGLNLNGPHAMHLHGIVNGEDVSASTCPTMADDADGDGVLTVAEGGPKYGGVQLSLTTSGDTSAESALAVDRFPSGTTVSYSRAGIPIPDNLKPNLAKLHVVVHGIDENGNGMLDLDQTERSSLTDDLPREATAPALCGTFAAAVTGPVQTGAGGTAETGSATGEIALVMAGVAALAGVAIVRRRT